MDGWMERWRDRWRDYTSQFGCCLKPEGRCFLTLQLPSIWHFTERDSGICIVYFGKFSQSKNIPTYPWNIPQIPNQQFIKFRILEWFGGERGCLCSAWGRGSLRLKGSRKSAAFPKATRMVRVLEENFDRILGNLDVFFWVPSLKLT